MFGMFRAGGFAAAIVILGANIIGAGPSQALDLQTQVSTSSLSPLQAAAAGPAAFASTQESPQISVPVQTAPSSPLHADISIGRVGDTAEPAVRPISPPSLIPAVAAAQHKTLAEMVAEHRSSEIPDRERECLAGAIYFESKGEPLSGQVAVGQVIANRAKSGRFPRSWCGVVLQRSQFSFVRGGGLPPIPRSSANWKTAVAIAHIVANDLAEAVAPKALFFHARRVSPGWKLSRVATVGNHIFYR